MSIDQFWLAWISSHVLAFAVFMLFATYASSRCFDGHEQVWKPPDRSRSFTAVLLAPLSSRSFASVIIAVVMGVSRFSKGQSFWNASLPSADLYSKLDKLFAADM